MATRFHEEFVVAAGNSILDVLAGILESLWSTQEITWGRSAVDGGDYPALRLRREVTNAHLRISRAIEKGDHVEAVRLTRGHLRAATPFVVSRGGQVRAIDRGGRRGTPRGRADPGAPRLRASLSNRVSVRPPPVGGGRTMWPG